MKRLLANPSLATFSILASFNLLGACSSSSNPAGSSGGAAGVGEAAATGGTPANGSAPGTGGASSSGDGSDVGNPDCESQVNFLCSQDLGGFPFVTVALTGSDYCTGDTIKECHAGVPIPLGETTSTLSETASMSAEALQPGRLCASGKISPGGWAFMAIEFAKSSLDRATILESFDAAGRGITQLAFTIDTPPRQGVTPILHMVTKTECPGKPVDCFYPPVFKLPDITLPGTITAAFTDFKPEGDPTLVLDTTKLHDLNFTINSGDFNFCIHDLKFLDVNGNEVKP